MIGKLFGKISGIFDFNKEDTNSKTVQEDDAKNFDPSIKLIDFVREIERYYREYIFHTRSKYVTGNLSDEDAFVFKRRIEQYEIALAQITTVRTKLVDLERNFSSIFGTESYSFGEQIESDSLEDFHFKSFEIAIQINSINVIPILDKIIANQLEIYRKDWNIQEMEISKNTSLRIIKVKDNAEYYQFGDFEKAIFITDSQALLPEQITAIKNLKIKFPFRNSCANKFWVRCTTITRRQLDFLKKSTIFPNDWEVGSSEEIFFDIVAFEDMEYYIKSLLQLLLTKKEYVMISVINITDEVFQFLKNIVQVDENKQKVKVVDKMTFWLAERNGWFKDDLLFNYLSSKDSLDKINFQSYRDFIKKFLIM